MFNLMYQLNHYYRKSIESIKWGKLPTVMAHAMGGTTAPAISSLHLYHGLPLVGLLRSLRRTRLRLRGASGAVGGRTHSYLS